MYLAIHHYNTLWDDWSQAAELLWSYLQFEWEENILQFDQEFVGETHTSKISIYRYVHCDSNGTAVSKFHEDFTNGSVLQQDTAYFVCRAPVSRKIII